MPTDRNAAAEALHTACREARTTYLYPAPETHGPRPLAPPDLFLFLADRLADDFISRREADDATMQKVQEAYDEGEEVGREYERSSARFDLTQFIGYHETQGTETAAEVLEALREACDL